MFKVILMNTGKGLFRVALLNGRRAELTPGESLVLEGLTQREANFYKQYLKIGLSVRISEIDNPKEVIQEVVKDYVDEVKEDIESELDTDYQGIGNEEEECIDTNFKPNENLVLSEDLSFDASTDELIEIEEPRKIPTVSEIEEMTKNELRELCQNLNIKYSNRDLKDELIDKVVEFFYE